MIVFENKGVLDIRAIKTFGVNSKENPSSAIGYFGTGLKYAIAILLRNGHKISIYTGGEHYEFGVATSRIRNDDFDIVTLNGEELGFTTELGKNWKMWMAYRELHSNMLDEGGEVNSCVAFAPGHTADDTYVVVSGIEFESLYTQRDNYFLNKEVYSALHEHKEVDVYPKTNDGRSEGHVFYKGVRVMETRGPALYDYNHHVGLTLTEDRTISNTWATLYHVSPVVKQSGNKVFIKQMVMCKNVYEQGIDFSMGTNSSIDLFLDVVGKLRKKYKDRGINATAIALHEKLRGVSDVMPGISCHINKVQTKQLERAVAFCKYTLGLDIDDYKLIICKDLADDLGQANVDEGIMYISKKCFDQGTKRVAVALLEEYTHCKHEVADETVEQKWVYLEQIISLGENLAGEPL